MDLANEQQSVKRHVESKHTERYGLACRRCGHHWTAHYLVQSRPRGGGRIAEFFYQRDVLVPSPWAFAECPSCHADWVRVVSVKTRRSDHTGADGASAR
jgi:hypothetical protein